MSSATPPSLNQPSNSLWNIDKHTLVFKGKNVTKKFFCTLIDEKSWRAPSELMGLTSRVKIKIGDDEKTIRVWNAFFGRSVKTGNDIKILDQMGQFISSEDELQRLLTTAKSFRASSDPEVFFPLQQCYEGIYDTVKITKSADGELEFTPCQSFYTYTISELNNIVNKNLNAEKSFRSDLSKLITIPNTGLKQNLPTHKYSKKQLEDLVKEARILKSNESKEIKLQDEQNTTIIITIHKIKDNRIYIK